MSGAAATGLATVERLIDLERRIEAEADSVRKLAASQPAVVALAEKRRAIAADHRRKLEQARERVTSVAPRLADLRALDALISLYASLNAAVLAYAALHALAHRAYDSSGEGNAADLAESQLREHARAIQELDLMLSDFAVVESSAAGTECRCRCPACSLGLCLCSSHGASTLRQAWQETIPAPAEGGVRVRPPRSGSEVQRADVRAGEVVSAIDGSPVANDLDITAVQTAIRAHGSGEEIRLTIQASDGVSREVTVRRP